MPHPLPQLSKDEVSRLLAVHFPQVNAGGKLIVLEAIEPMSATVRMVGQDSILRPGGTISGPAMVLLADVGIYVAILGTLGEAALQAVTSGLSINFLARPEPRDLIANVRLLKTGRRLTFGEVEIHTDSRERAMVAHATATYAMPSDKRYNDTT